MCVCLMCEVKAWDICVCVCLIREGKTWDICVCMSDVLGKGVGYMFVYV